MAALAVKCQKSLVLSYPLFIIPLINRYNGLFLLQHLIEILVGRQTSSVKLIYSTLHYSFWNRVRDTWKNSWSSSFLNFPPMYFTHQHLALLWNIYANLPLKCAIYQSLFLFIHLTCIHVFIVAAHQLLFHNIYF